MTDRRALGLLTVLMLSISLPFVHRAYFVDDFYFVTMAQGIRQHPARPYDFLSDDAGIANIAWERGKAPRMVNPPLFHYFLAAVIALWGDAVWKLRTASLIFPLLSLYAVYFLGKRFVRHPLAAASLLAITPAFWLTSYSLLIDSALLAFFLLSLVCFIEGQEKKRLSFLILSGGLMGLTLLTKYTGFLILPVVVVWHVLHRKTCSWKGTLLAMAVCGLIFLLWGVWGIATYGQMHFTATLSRGFHPTAPLGVICLGLFGLGSFFRWKASGKLLGIVLSWCCWIPCLILPLWALLEGSTLAAWLATFYLDKVISVASFLGGTSVFLFFAPVLLWARSKQAVGAWGGLWMALFLCFASRYGGFDRLQSATLTFFICATIAFLILLGTTSSPASDRKEQFLLAWLLMGLLELIVVMPWTAARYLLVVLPPVVWFFQRMIEASGHQRLGKVAWAATALLGGTLAYVDFAQAGVIVPLSKVLETQQAVFQRLAPRPRHHWYYLADTFDGSQPYILRLGWENVFPFQEFPSGSLFLRSYYRKSSWWNIRDRQRFRSVMAWDFDSWIPLRVMDVPAAAGFYASCWGTLPYAITRHPLERFELFIVK